MHDVADLPHDVNDVALHGMGGAAGTTAARNQRPCRWLCRPSEMASGEHPVVQVPEEQEEQSSHGGGNGSDAPAKFRAGNTRPCSPNPTNASFTNVAVSRNAPRGDVIAANVAVAPSV